jgi:hypothetical protein
VDNIFLFKLLISFLAGSAWVVFATILADKYGPKVGGLVSGLPSTAIFILLFLALTQGTIFAVKANYRYSHYCRGGKFIPSRLLFSLSQNRSIKGVSLCLNDLVLFGIFALSLAL